ncbi:plasmodesmata-located protein 3-like [Zingiber officinale]|uniref:Gnk2-homologous domain-containing protein n=1 Tax=Zingiber officinale TaxID=94328 RepID=A0A8J5GI39_ZINOF|nr:plasmodesmata-located protein 3-like [Zingiber officinale]KAG6504049.1 hypothetical protein ZIOFF_036374 [Zingiber officinale]
MARFHLLHFQTLPDRYRLQPSPLTSSTSSTTNDKGCANQTVASGLATLAALSCALTSQAISSKFYHTTASSADGGPSFLGLFKCHGDLSASDCFSPAATPFTMYTVSSFPHDPSPNCSTKPSDPGAVQVAAATWRPGLRPALGRRGGRGFSATSYVSVYTLVQCEGNLSASDCTDCAMQAVELPPARSTSTNATSITMPTASGGVGGNKLPS